jgi:hypothetical protein|tara:strand:- start:327 stop:899 length:573 start_codon:yes stop_codon:yes gene_type:complete
MNDLFDEMESDARGSKVENLNTESVKTIAEVARLLLQKQDEVETLEKALKVAKQDLLKISDEDLPAMLQEIGMTNFELTDGSKVEVRATYGAHIKVDSKAEAFEWLRDHGFDDIIKNQVTCVFGRGEDQSAVTFMNMAAKEGYEAQQKEEVHPSTLKAFVKERVESGSDFPEELFGAYVGQRATLKKGKR